MIKKLRISILLLIFSLSIFAQVAQAAAYQVASPQEEIILFNRALLSGESEITLNYDTDRNDYSYNPYDHKYALQDYTDSDYAYYIMDHESRSKKESIGGNQHILQYTYSIYNRETTKQTKYVYDTIHKLIQDNPSIIKASDYDKAAWAYDYVTSHVTYDDSNDDNPLKYSAYNALHDGVAVCQGYSLLYYALTTELGLKCKIVSGEADNGSSSGAHAWNVLELGGKWYCVDTTWGAGTGNRKYFLVLKKDLTSHTFDPIYEDYFNYATSAYAEDADPDYHGVLASVYQVDFDALKIITLEAGDSFQWMLSNPNNTPLTFSSEASDVAKVSQKGSIQAVGAGTVTIKATNEELGIEQVCKVIVNKPEAKVTGYKNISVTYNKKASISLQVSPSNAKLDQVSYKSQDTSIATVNSKGVVTGKHMGNTTVTVTYGNNHKVKIPVTVLPAYDEKYKSVTVAVNKTTSIKNAVKVSDKGYKDLIFLSGYSRIAKVSSNGTVTGVSRGSCYLGIYDKASGHLLATVKVTVH